MFVQSLSVCGGCRARRAFLAFVARTLLLCASFDCLWEESKSACVLARQLKRPSVTVQRRFTFILSLSVSTLTSLGSARPETLSPFPLNPAALLEAKAGFSLTQLTSPSARPPTITVPTQKKSKSFQTTNRGSSRARKKKRKRRERDGAKGARPPLGPLGPRRRLRCRCRRRGADEKQFFSSRLLSLVVGAENETPVSCSLWPLFGHGFAQCRKRVLIGNVTGSREWGSTASHLRPLVVTTWVRFVYKSLVGEPYARVSA